MTVTEVAVRAERGMSAPPEVVFNTAIDPSRGAAWLPQPFLTRGAGPERGDDGLRARWRVAGWTADLVVRPESAGGARARLDLAVEPSATDAPDDRRLAGIADDSLAGLASQVADNLTAG